MDEVLRKHLECLKKGDKVPVIAIGCFTPAQFESINVGRASKDLHLLEDNEILFLGRHLLKSRTADGYSIDDIAVQIASALCIDALPHVTDLVSYTQNPNARDDGYGNRVNDRAILEMTARKPKAELFSVYPRGDEKKPTKKATP